MADVFAWVITIALIWGVPMYLAKRLGDRRGKRWAWVWPLALSWFGLPFAFIGKPTQDGQNPRESGTASTRSHIIREDDLHTREPCSECGGLIRRQADYCKFCGHRRDATAA